MQVSSHEPFPNNNNHNNNKTVVQKGHLDLQGRQRLPVVRFELVQLVKLEADILDGQLQHVPEASQVLGDGSRMRVGVLNGTQMLANQSEISKIVHS